MGASSPIRSRNKCKSSHPWALLPGNENGRDRPGHFFSRDCGNQRRLEATKSQLTSAQNDSTYFGRALR